MNIYKFLFTAFFISIGNYAFCQDTTSLNLYYATNEYILSKSQERSIITLFNSHSEDSITLVKIDGYTDADANKSYNYKLSKSRTENAELIINDLTNAPIVKTYNGENFSIEKASERQKEKERFVRIQIIYQNNITSLTKKNKVDTPSLKTDSIENTLTDSLTTQKHNKKPIEYYTRTTVNDIKYSVRKDTAGNYPSFTITESVNQEDMIKNNINTVSTDDILLESYYMVNIQSRSLTNKDTVYIKIPASIMKNQKDLGWYVRNEKNGKWKLAKPDLSNNYNEECDCYILKEFGWDFEFGVNFNLDKRLPGNTKLIIVHNAKGLKPNKLLGVFNQYIYAHPEFRLFPTNYNSSIVAGALKKNKAIFYNIPDTLIINLTSKINLDNDIYHSQEIVDMKVVTKKRKTFIYIPKLIYIHENKFKYNNLTSSKLFTTEN